MLRSKMRFREGRQLRSYDVEIDTQRMMAAFKNKTTNEKWEHEISLPIFDLVSLIYWLRTQEHSPGEVFSVFFVDGGISWGTIKEVEIEVFEPERVSAYARTFSAIKYSESGQDNRITVWISERAGKIPVKIQVSTRLGLLTAYLAEMEGVVGE